jgi:hypothetical protein
VSSLYKYVVLTASCAGIKSSIARKGGIYHTLLSDCTCTTSDILGIKGTSLYTLKFSWRSFVQAPGAGGSLGGGGGGFRLANVGDFGPKRFVMFLFFSVLYCTSFTCLNLVVHLLVLFLRIPPRPSLSLVPSARRAGALPALLTRRPWRRPRRRRCLN